MDNLNYHDALWTNATEDSVGKQPTTEVGAGTLVNLRDPLASATEDQGVEDAGFIKAVSESLPVRENV